VPSRVDLRVDQHTRWIRIARHVPLGEVLAHTLDSPERREWTLLVALLHNSLERRLALRIHVALQILYQSHDHRLVPALGGGDACLPPWKEQREQPGQRRGDDPE